MWKRNGRHIVIFQYDTFVNHRKSPFLWDVFRWVATIVLLLIHAMDFAIPVYLICHFTTCFYTGQVVFATWSVLIEESLEGRAFLTCSNTCDSCCGRLKNKMSTGTSTRNGFMVSLSIRGEYKWHGFSVCLWEECPCNSYINLSGKHLGWQVPWMVSLQKLFLIWEIQSLCGAWYRIHCLSEHWKDKYLFVEQTKQIPYSFEQPVFCAEVKEFCEGT